MNRRSFLALPALALIPRAAWAAPPLVHPQFGRFLRARAWQGDYGRWDFPGRGPYPRYATFPVETFLTAEFEGGELGYLGFNGSRALCRKLEGMAGQEVFGPAGPPVFADHVDFDPPELAFADPDSVLRDVDPFWTPHRDWRPPTVRFRLHSMTVHPE